MKTDQVLSQILKNIEGNLGTVGFRRTGPIYTCHITDDVEGWLGLNTATRRSDRRIGVNPVVGIRYKPLENMVEELSQNKHGLSATLNISVGYLMPEARFLEWLFEPGLDNNFEAEKMVRAIELYGVPFMKTNSDLKTIVEALEQLRFTYLEAAIYRLPAAYLILKKKALALDYMRDQLVKLGDRQDAAAKDYREFSSNLRLLVTAQDND